MKQYKVTWKEYRVDSFTNVIPAKNKIDAEKSILENKYNYRIDVNADESVLDYEHSNPILITDVQEEE